MGWWWWVYLDYSVSSGPFLRFSMRFEFLSEMFDHSVCETRDPSLTKIAKSFIKSLFICFVDMIYKLRVIKLII